MAVVCISKGIHFEDTDAIFVASLSTRIAQILADIIALQVTWRRTIEVVRAETIGTSFSFSKAMFRDGKRLSLFSGTPY